jgi:hypothetical protein
MDLAKLILDTCAISIRRVQSGSAERAEPDIGGGLRSLTSAFLRFTPSSSVNDDCDGAAMFCNPVLCPRFAAAQGA